MKDLRKYYQRVEDVSQELQSLRDLVDSYVVELRKELGVLKRLINARTSDVASWAHEMKGSLRRIDALLSALDTEV